LLETSSILGKTKEETSLSCERREKIGLKDKKFKKLHGHRGRRTHG